MKTYISLFLLAITAILLAACGNDDTKKASADQLQIYTTVYPLQYFAEEIGQEHVTVDSIYPPGTNEHSFDPTQKDMMKLADSDLFFYIGLGLEGFVDNAKKSLASENTTFVETTSTIDDELFHVSTETKEAGHEEHEHEHEEEHEDDGHHHGNIDPHVWLSPVISQELAESVKNALIQKDAKHKADYEQNYEKLIVKLQKLNKDYAKMAQDASTKSFYVSHASFGYIAGTYGLNQVSVAGLNSQDEPTQKELTKIVDQAKKDNIHYILFEQNVSSKLSEVIQKDVGAENLTVHNLSVLTKEDLAQKRDYVSIMEDNLQVFQKALSK